MGEKTKPFIMKDPASVPDEEWQSGSLSQDNRNIYPQDQEQVSLHNIELEDKPVNKPHRYIPLGCCRKKQGFNLFGHCLLLFTFIFSLLLIVILIYYMD